MVTGSRRLVRTIDCLARVLPDMPVQRETPVPSRLETLISVVFKPKHVKACLGHFAEVSGAFKISGRDQGRP
jgi:hypothetical protein